MLGKSTNMSQVDSSRRLASRRAGAGRAGLGAIWFWIASIAVLAACCGANRLSAAPIGGSTTIPEAAPAAVPDTNPPEVQDAIKRFNGGDAAAACELLKKAAAKYPQLSPPRVMLASLYLTDNQRAAGLEQLEAAAQDYPDDPEPHLIFADIGVVEPPL